MLHPGLSRLSLRTTWIVALAVVAGLGLAVRMPSIAEPLGIDQSLWASAARGLSRGLVIYRDVWDHKPPGIFLAYLATFDLFGWTSGSIAWLDLVASIATTALVFVIVRRLESLATAMLAAALYAVLTVPSWLYGNGGFLERSVAETFVVVGVGTAAWCAAGFRALVSVGRAFGIGLGVGVAIVFKPNAAVYLPVLLIWIGLYACSWRETARVAAIAILGSIVAPALTIAWLWHGHVLLESWVALVEFNRFYLAEGFTLQQALHGFSNAIGFRVKHDPLWAAGAVGALLVAWDALRTRRIDPLAAMCVLWGAGAAVAIFANGARLFNSYFIQALPALAMLAAWAIVGVARAPIVHRLGGAAAAIFVVLLMGQRQYVTRVADVTRLDLKALTGHIERVTYLDQYGGYATGRGYSAHANDDLFTYVRDHTSRDDRIYQFGINGSGIYFATDRLPAARFLRATAFLPPTLTEPGFQRATVLDTIARARPVYIIFEQLHHTSQEDVATTVDRLPQDEDVTRVLADYRLDTQIEDFTLYRRK
jgi:hypothetical protein